MRDGQVWASIHYDTYKNLNITLVAVVKRPGSRGFDITLEAGSPVLSLKEPLEQTEAIQFTVSPFGDQSYLDEQSERFAEGLKKKLAPIWHGRWRRHDPALAVYCVYLRDVGEMSPMGIWNVALADAPGGWGAHPTRKEPSGRRGARSGLTKFECCLQRPTIVDER